MGDRANDAKAGSYTAQDLMIVERDVGRLAKYTFEMGGTGELLALALSVPPWEPLHELSQDELRIGNLVTDSVVADASASKVDAVRGTVAANAKPIQDRVAADVVSSPTVSTPAMKPTKTAEATPPTGGSASAAPQQ
jgi:hypothetical protein